jgi:Tfp pilus assembly protein PilF
MRNFTSGRASVTTHFACSILCRKKIERTPEVIALRTEILSEGEIDAEQRAALEELLARDPKNASLLARLGNSYRRVDPVKSRDYYFRALQLEPKNENYAVGYARRWSNPGNSAKLRSSCGR